MRVKRRGVSLIELLIFVINVGVAVSIADGVRRVGGGWFAIPVGIAVYFMILSFWFKLADISWPDSPDRCESGKCDLYSCYNVLIGLLGGRYSIRYFKCGCGDEYLLYGNKFFAKIREDGSLEPYKKHTCFSFLPFVDWYKDDGRKSGVNDYKFDPELLDRLRQGIEKDMEIE